MAGCLHGVFVGEWLFVFPLCGFSLSLFCNYGLRNGAPIEAEVARGAMGLATAPTELSCCGHLKPWYPTAAS